MLSEKEVWLLMADSFRNPTKPTPLYGTVCGQIKIFDNQITSGLCPCIKSLINWGKIDEKMWWVIYNKIEGEGLKIHGTFSGYIWPLTQDGAKSRVEFCERIASQL